MGVEVELAGAGGVAGTTAAVTGVAAMTGAMTGAIAPITTDAIAETLTVMVCPALDTEVEVAATVSRPPVLPGMPGAVGAAVGVRGAAARRAIPQRTVIAPLTATTWRVAAAVCERPAQAQPREGLPVAVVPAARCATTTRRVVAAMETAADVSTPAPS